MAAEGGHIDFMFLGPPLPGRWIRYCKGLAIYAVDGNREGNFHDQSCSLTAVEEVPWWVVDLQAEAEIGHVAITNTADPGKNLFSLSNRVFP